MRSLCRYLLVLVLGSWLAGCASGVTADVTRFHTISAPLAGSFAIVPDEEQTGSLQFGTYAGILASELMRLGLTPAAAGSQPDYVVHFTVSHTQYRLDSEDGPVDVGVGVGGGSRGTHVGLGIGINLGGGQDQRGYIDRLGVTLNRGVDGERIFEGQASIHSRAADVGKSLGYLARAVFTDFPGKSGTTQSVTVKTGTK